MVIERARLAEVHVFIVMHKEGVPRGIKAIDGFIKSDHASILNIQGHRHLEQSQKDLEEAPRIVYPIAIFLTDT
ncbi:MAG: hypothetical protein COA78_11175 [Blastopirellula sp.]|nr:MAG: hypothetical protein COA78_11175 [Blastopirellula sp.]